MGILEVLFLIKLLRFMNAAADCSISACGIDDVPVRFPFRLQGNQPRNCGYPGFDLSCNNRRTTVLKLPHSGDFLVRDIDYRTQQIQLYDKDNCLPKRLLQLNLSGSPFAAVFHQNYTFLSCPTQFVMSRFPIIDCLSNSTISVLATSSTFLVTLLSSSCDVISTLLIPASWPVQHYEGFSSKLSEDLLLTWFSPDCHQCETHGGTCGFHGNASQEIGCFYDSKKGNISYLYFYLLSNDFITIFTCNLEKEKAEIPLRNCLTGSKLWYLRNKRRWKILNLVLVSRFSTVMHDIGIVH
jgi:hypothetical protein